MFARCIQIGAWIYIAAALLAGCVMKEPVKQTQQSASITKQEEVQSDMEREMVILFQSLVQMDKEDHLSINKKQAEELLPAVKRNSREGELTLIDQQIIVSALTIEQRRFVINFQQNVHEHMQATKEKKDRDKLDREERERMVREFQMRRQEHDQESNQEDNRMEKPNSELTSDSSTKKSNNVEQRLILLLENRLQEEEKRK
ncbi:hypothetical protein [Paenibacillus sp. UNC451MF]|uniref:hypothetical protein n=1 Tax=Paenibacillus sp. UNC451MF TaxID=1449063 RepID=UPI000491AAA6|nr:hypothetical protein [Paenibacillus sp. UNC451MF]